MLFKLKLFVLIIFLMGVNNSYALIGTLASLAVNAASRGQGNICLKEDTKIGDEITSIAGHTGLVKTVSSISPLCKNPALPVQANVEFAFNYVSKFKIELPEDYEIKPLNDLQRYQGTIISAISKDKKSTGIIANSRKRTLNTNPEAVANGVSQAQINALEDAVSLNPKQTKINGLDTWSFEIRGKLKGVFGQKIVYLITVIDSKDELIILSQYAPDLEFDKNKNLILALTSKFSGLELRDLDVAVDNQKTDSRELNEVTKTELKPETLVQPSSSVNSNELNKEQDSKSDLRNNPTIISANRRALVIGNDTYKIVTKLVNAREDAKSIASNLSAVGYQVTLKLDLNEKEMKSAIRAFAAQVNGGDEVLFYFAGHGVQLGATNYLLPVDIGGESEVQVRDEAIQLQRILDDMSDRKAKFTLAMIDACRDNPFKLSGRAIGGRGLAPTTAATGQMVVFSAGAGQQALDRLGSSDKNKNGVFTRTFIKEMQKSGVSIDRIVKNVRNEVAELAKSVGHEQVPAIYDQVLGDFYFKK